MSISFKKTGEFCCFGEVLLLPLAIKSALRMTRPKFLFGSFLLGATAGFPYLRITSLCIPALPKRLAGAYNVVILSL